MTRPFIVELSSGELAALLMACGYTMAGSPPGNIPDLLRTAAVQLSEAATTSEHREIVRR